MPKPLLSMADVSRAFRAPDMPVVREPQVDDRAYKRRLRALYARITEGLRLVRPEPLQEQFLSSLAKFRVAEGSNRSCKSMAGAIEFARCVTNQDPYGKFPANGQGLVVALDWQPHVSELWRKMTCEGEFKTIIDEKLGLPRAVDPRNEYDQAYREKWKDGAPLIPPRYIKRVNQTSKSPPTPRWAQFVTDRGIWEVDFRSSKGTPVHGKHYNFAWFDEQLDNEEFYYEAVRGLVAINESHQHRPRFWWTATGQITNPQYFELCEQAYHDSANVAAFMFLIKDNPYVSDEEKQAFYDALPEDQRATRYHGQHAMVAARIYGQFDPSGPHGCEPFAIPPDWARYVALDPGRRYCATIFAAVPPDEKHVYIYDGFLLRNDGALAWAGEIKKRQGDTKFEAFVIDRQAGQQHGMGSEDNEGVADKFWDALMQAQVAVRSVCAAKWAGFYPGTKDVRAREESLKGWMAIRGAGPGTGTARLQIFRGTLPQLEKQIRYAVMNRDDPTKRDKREEDLLDALEYMAHFDPHYAAPEQLYQAAKPDSIGEQWRQLQRQQRMRERLSDVYV